MYQNGLVKNRIIHRSQAKAYYLTLREYLSKRSS